MIVNYHKIAISLIKTLHLSFFCKKSLSLIHNKNTNFFPNTSKNHLSSICNLNRMRSSKLSKSINKLKKASALIATLSRHFFSTLTLLSDKSWKFVLPIDWISKIRQSYKKIISAIKICAPLCSLAFQPFIQCKKWKIISKNL